MNDNALLRVIKVGGSLLQWSEVADAFRRWLTGQSAMTNLLVVGGGVLADEVRAMDQRFQVSAETSHRLAVEAMAINSHLLQALLQVARPLFLSEYVGGLDTSRTAPAVHAGLTEASPSLCDGGLWIIEPVDFMRHVEVMAEGQSLPIGWHVTSDSIAARVADVVHAKELVLLKAALPETTRICSRGDAATAGFVDQYFADAAARLVHIRAVNLRDALFAECPLA